MGVVYLADDERLRRPVAIKFLKAATAQQARDRIFHEARAASALNHPHICTVYDVGEYEGEAFLVMEFLDGKTLADHLAEGPLAVPMAIDVALQIADALQAAHCRGIIHRDLKPANVFVTSRGDVKVLDFGIAEVNTVEATAGGPDPDANEVVTRTVSGGAIGTPLYMSPEQARGERLDGGTDIYSLGVTLYEMVTGVVPFKDESAAEMVGAIPARTPARPSSINSNVPRALDVIVLRTLEKTRSSRYRDSAELLAELRGLQARLGRRWHRTIVLASALAALAIVATVWIESRRPSGRGIELTPLTNSGRVDAAAISPDGRAIVFHNRGTPRILRHPLDGTPATVISTDAPSNAIWMQFGPDNRMLYVKNIEDSTVVRLDIATGARRVVAEDVWNLPAVSNDGKRLVFGRLAAGRSVVVNAATDGGDERTVLTASVAAPSAFAWSPDDQKLAMITQRGVAVVPVTGGVSTPLSTPGWERFTNVHWTAPGNRLLLLGVPPDSDMVSRGQLLEVSYPAGEVRRLTNDLADYVRMTATVDGSILSTIVRETQSKISIREMEDAEGERIVPGGRDDGAQGVAWLDDGRLVLSDSSSVMWVTDISGSTRTALLPANGRGWALAQCGPRSLAFTALKKGELGVFFLEPGSTPRQIATFPTLSSTVRGYPSCTPDGRSLVYTDGRTIQRVDLQTGASAAIANGARAHHPDISPDGTRIVYHAVTGEGERLIVASMDSGAMIRTLEQPFLEAAMHWSADGRSIIGVTTSAGNENLLRIDVTTGATAPVTRFSDRGTLFEFAIDRHGRLAIARGERALDVVLIRPH